MKKNRALLITVIFSIIFTFVTGTFAYLIWRTTDNDKIAVGVEIPNLCSVSVDGGGEVDSTTITMMPANCVNTAASIIKEITLDIEFQKDNPDIYVDLWLDVNSIDNELSASKNFRYALSSSSVSCTDGAIFSGNFNGLTDGGRVRIFGKTYSGNYPDTLSETYYLYIWLDAAETNPATAGKEFSLSLGGECGNSFDETIPTVSLTHDSSVSATKNVSIYLTDDEGVESYYFGKEEPTSTSALWNAVGGVKTYSGTVTADSSGEYYLAVKDTSNQMNFMTTTFYTTTLSVSNGSVEPSSILMAAGNTFAIPEPTMDKDYVFEGWYTSSDFSGSPITQYTSTSDVTLYAKTVYSPEVIPVAITYKTNVLTDVVDKTAQGVTISYDEDTSYLTLDGTQAGNIEISKFLKQSFTAGEQYEVSLTYVSGDVTRNDDYIFSVDVYKDSDNFALSTRNNADIIGMPASGTKSTTLTISDVGASEGELLNAWIWVNSSGAVVFNDYVVKVTVSKIETIEANVGDNYSVPSTPSKSGYTFIGWYTSESGGVPVSNSSVVNLAVDHTIYAQWVVNKVYVQLNVNGGTVTGTTIDDDNVTYTWTTDNSGMINRSVAGNSTDILKTINYGDAIDSDGLPDYNNPNYINISKEGYSAVENAEWVCLGGDCTVGTTYDQTEIYSVDDFCDTTNGDCTVVLGVNWQLNTYTINYEANLFSGLINGSKNGVSTKTSQGVTISYDEDTSYLTLDGTQTGNINISKFLKQSFTTGEQYKVSLTYISGAVTRNDDYTFSVDVYKDSDNFALSTRNHADIIGMPASGTKSSVLTISDVGASEGELLNAWIWVNSSGAVVFNNYVVKVVITKVVTDSANHSTTYNLPVTNPTRMGFTFNGWYTAENGGTQVTDSTVVNSGDHTIYAQWTRNKVYVQLNVNGGAITGTTTGTDNAQYTWTTDDSGLITRTDNDGSSTSTFRTINYGDAIVSDGLPNYNNESYINITRIGYIAAANEWICLSGDCTVDTSYDQATVYDAVDFCDASEGDCTVVLGVNWTPRIITVTFMRNHSANDTTSTTQSFTYGGSDQTFSSEFTKSGATLVGWSITQSVNVPEYLLDTAVTDSWIDDNYPSITLYAVWNTNKYTTTAVNCRTGPGTSNSIKTTIGCGTLLYGYSYSTSWFYNAKNDCYMWAEYLSSSKTSCSTCTYQWTGYCNCSSVNADMTYFGTNCSETVNSVGKCSKFCTDNSMAYKNSNCAYVCK